MKSHSLSRDDFPEENQSLAFYSAGAKNRERLRNRVRHCKTSASPALAQKETAATGVGARDGGEKSIVAEPLKVRPGQCRTPAILTSTFLVPVWSDDRRCFQGWEARHA